MITTIVLLIALIVTILSKSFDPKKEEAVVEKQIPTLSPIVSLEPTPTLHIKETVTGTLSPVPTKVSAPTTQVQNYPRPQFWSTVAIKNKYLSVCLPPKWDVSDEFGSIIFNRDPGYKPNVAQINTYDYKGGSRRDEYINLKVQYEYEPNKLKNETNVTDLSINGKSVLKISIPSFPEALVFVINNRLYAVELSLWNLVNDSQAAFNKDIYTMIGCAQPI